MPQNPLNAASPSSNLYHDVFEQDMSGGSVAREQREDDRLKHCWGQVRAIEGKETQPGPHPLPHFYVRNGLLYCVAQRRGELKPSGAIAEVWPGPLTHPGDRQFCQPVPGSCTLTESHSQGNSPETVPAVQLGRHTHRYPDRPGDSVCVRANG